MSPELEDECGSCDFPFVNTKTVREKLYKLNVHKSMWPDGIHLRALKELADIMVGHLLIIYQSNVLGVWGDPCCLEANQCYSNIPKAREGRPRELQTS